MARTLQLFFKNPKDFALQYDFFPKSNVIKLTNTRIPPQLGELLL